MALIKSTILSAIRGSINGTTFSQNRYGAYARNRTVLANPNTPNQALIRASLATAAQSWKVLSDAQRLAWQTYAAATPVPNRVGDMVHLSGIAAYNKSNTLLLFLGKGQNTAAPTSPGLAEPVAEFSALLEDDGTVSLSDFTGGSTNAAANYGFWISLPVSPGVSFYKGPWTYIGTLNGTGRAGIISVSPGIAFTVGQLYFLRTRYVDEGNKVSIETTTGPITVTPAT